MQTLQMSSADIDNGGGKIKKMDRNGSGSKVLKNQHASTLSCHHIHYTVKVKPPGKRGCGRAVPKEILHDINGVFRPGMNAILGPTGSGKSSLLDVLAGRKDPQGLSGHVLVDGKRQPKNFKCLTGYVVQDDVVMGTLSVRENFMFSANLRLPKSISHSDKLQRVEDTVNELGLTKCADSRVGTEFIRGVSGGERKRTNIGMELIISPSVLFLDEPTTGLDASTAFAVMTLLQGLSRKGRTIIFSIHQPRYSIFKQFDTLMLLAAGRPIFHGPASDALQYFSSIGYTCEEHNNPPDFVLDIINGDSTAVQSIEPSKPDEQPNVNQASRPSSGVTNAAFKKDSSIEVELVNGEPEQSLAITISNKFIASPWNQKLSAELQPIWNEFQQKQNSHEPKLMSEHINYSTSFLRQLRYVSQRTVTNLMRNPQTSVMQFIVITFFAILVGVIYLQVSDLYPAGLQNRVGTFFFIIMNQIFGNLSAVQLFIDERKIFIHENVSGFYRVSAYFFAKLFCDLIPLRLLPLCFFTVITYFMIGLQMNAAKFFIYLFNLFVTVMAASGIGFLISSTVNIFAIANLLIALTYVIMMVFGGLLVNINDMPDWLNWLQYLSVVRYSLNALSINELKDMKFYLMVNGTKIPSPVTGNSYLESQGIKYETAWDLWHNMMALAIIATGLMILTYVQLRRMKKLK